MKERLRFLFENNWPELLIVPPVLLGVCYFIYGENYFSSMRTFSALSLPWVLFSATVARQCNWWRLRMHGYFLKLEDWWKRLVFSILGYIFVHVLCFCAIFILFKDFWIEEVSLVNEKIYILIILDFPTIIIITTLYEGITFFDKWKEAVTEAKQLEKLYLETQFQSLQSQLNPHFLFNSFNVLSSLIAENPRRAEDFVDELSNVYRYLLRSNEQELAAVGEEMRFIHSFFHLLETRHDAGVSMKNEVSKAVFDKKMPALALQILVENAVKHNEISSEKPLQIEIFDGKSAGQTCLIVRNNMQPKATRPYSTRVGLNNLRQRYELLGVAGFEVQDDGHYFTVSLPLL